MKEAVTMKYTELPFDFESYFVKKKKPAVSFKKIIGIGAGIAALAAFFPYLIQIGDEKKSFKVKSLALDVSGKVDENDEWNIDINLPWLKSRCDSCSECADAASDLYDKAAEPSEADGLGKSEDAYKSDDICDLEAIDGACDKA